MTRHTSSSSLPRSWRSLARALSPALARAALAGAALAAATLAVGGTSAAASPGAASPGLKAACPVAAPRHARCLTLYRPEVAVNRALAAGVRGLAAQPAGWGARAIESAYKLPVSRNPHAVVAVSIAFNTPHLAQYLNTYRAQYGLPPCTAASGCFRKVNQQGNASPLPASGVGSGWDLEATLDVSMISAACPHCRILVVEADSDQLSDLAATEHTAARLGAAVISNSYGTRESGYTQTLAHAYHQAGHTVVVSSGDSGFTAASFPANLTSVTAVGGTMLARATNARGWRESVWNDQFGASGSGCSAYVAKPARQHDQDCLLRTVSDVSAVAANIPIFNQDWGGWVSVEGTSASAPLIAGVYALAGNATKVGPGYPYRHAGSLFDVTSGNNDWFNNAGGASCGNDYLCVAKPGYDAPTGLGTPHGTGAF